jgi:hypothetical protein
MLKSLFQCPNPLPGLDQQVVEMDNLIVYDLLPMTNKAMFMLVIVVITEFRYLTTMDNGKSLLDQMGLEMVNSMVQWE